MYPIARRRQGPKHTPMKYLRKHLLPVLKLRFLVYIACLAVWVSPVSAEMPSSSRVWAEKIQNQNLSNFHRVSDDLYRGAQPSINGFQELQRLGIRTIINLRSLHSDKPALKSTNLRYEEIKMRAEFPSQKQVLKFLRIVSNRENGPFLVHCQYGSDRTGTMTAIYRIILQGWSKDEAIAEMTSTQFGFNKIWNLTLVTFIRKIDVDALKHKAGLNRSE